MMLARPPATTTWPAPDVPATESPATDSRALPPPSGRPAPLRSPRRWPVRAAGAILLAAALLMNRSGAFVVVALFVLVVPFERLFPRHRQPLRRPELATDVAYGLAAPALRIASVVVGVAVGICSLAWLPGLALRPLVAALPGPARLVLGVILLDVTTYWLHRFAHEVPFLWRFHAVHHSTTRLDWASGLRAHPLDGAFLAPPLVLLLAAGFPLRLTGGLAAVQVVLDLFLHANVRWRWRLLHRVVITPEFHHWHHANEADAHNTNYSVLLPLWDQLFGTYFMPAGRRPMRYGIDEPMPTGMVHQLRYPLRGLPPARRLVLAAARHPVRSAGQLGRAVRRGVGQMWASARRPTRRFLDWRA